MRFDLDSVGAIVFRELLGDFDFEVFLDQGVLFAEPFDPDAPVATPRGLTPADAPDDDRVLEALIKAIDHLEVAGLPLDAPLGDVQFTKKGDVEIPMHGGGRNEGITNLIIYSELKSTLEESMPRGKVINPDTDLTEDGYVVNYGTSFIMTMEFGEDGPRAEAFLTYSESADPSSDYFADQTEAFSQKAWRKCLFREQDILDDPELETYSVTGARE
jgi:acyl-homoserine-lactone acylase